MKPSVLDASVAIKWFLDEPGGDRAALVLEQIIKRDGEWVVPELFFFEVLSVCARRHPDPSDFALQDMPFLLALPLTRVSMTSALARDSVALVAKGLSGYDAAYAALAQQIHGVWLTFDAKAAARLGSPRWVRVLTEDKGPQLLYPDRRRRTASRPRGH